MMRRLEPTAIASGVPPALLDWDAVAWTTTSIAFRTWLADNRVDMPSSRHLDAVETLGIDGGRWRLAVDAWSTTHGYGKGGRPDWQRLAEVGVRPMCAVDRARRRARRISATP